MLSKSAGSVVTLGWNIWAWWCLGFPLHLDNKQMHSNISLLRLVVAIAKKDRNGFVLCLLPYLTPVAFITLAILVPLCLLSLPCELPGFALKCPKKSSCMIRPKQQEGHSFLLQPNTAAYACLIWTLVCDHNLWHIVIKGHLCFPLLPFSWNVGIYLSSAALV